MTRQTVNDDIEEAADAQTERRPEEEPPDGCEDHHCAPLPSGVLRHERAFHEPRVEITAHKVRMLEDLAEKGDRRADWLDGEFRKAPPHGGDGLNARWSVHNQLGK